MPLSVQQVSGRHRSRPTLKRGAALVFPLPRPLASTMSTWACRTETFWSRADARKWAAEHGPTPTRPLSPTSNQHGHPLDAVWHFQTAMTTPRSFRCRRLFACSGSNTHKSLQVSCPLPACFSVCSAARPIHGGWTQQAAWAPSASAQARVSLSTPGASGARRLARVIVITPAPWRHSSCIWGLATTRTRIQLMTTGFKRSRLSQPSPRLCAPSRRATTVPPPL